MERMFEKDVIPREVAARTSQAPEDALSHDLTRPGMLLRTFPNREMSPRSAVGTRTALPVTDQLAALESRWIAPPPGRGQ
jgi:hypothetical protein